MKNDKRDAFLLVMIGTVAFWIGVVCLIAKDLP